MKKLEVIEFEHPSRIINGMLGCGEKIIVKAIGNFKCVDLLGNEYILSNCKEVGTICECVLITYFPFLHEIKEAIYNGKKVLKIDIDYSHEFYNKQKKIDVDFDYIDSQVVYKQNPIKINCGGRNIKLNYEPRDYARKVAICSKVLSVETNIKNRTSLSVNSSGMWYSYDGGGYGEKYYLRNVYFSDTNKLKGFEIWLMAHLNVPSLSEDFVKYCQFGKLWNYIQDEKNWDVEVEYVDYEGYCVKGIKFIGSNILVLKMLVELIDNYNKPIHNTFGFVK